MKKQTAVEFYRTEFGALVSMKESKFQNENEIFEQAKQMEKEQMIKFSYKVLNESNDSITGYVDEEKIYNETYGGQDERQDNKH
jgi:hypothetical protein